MRNPQRWLISPSIWNPLNKLEMHIIAMVQKILMVKNLGEFYHYFSYLFSVRVLSFIPIFLYSIDMKSAAQGMSSQLVFASFLIALISFVNPRVRPGGHGTGGVVHVPCFLGSSMLLLTIVLNYAPYREFHFIVFILAALDQMAIGNMYLSDCLMGVFFGILMNKFNPSEISITLYLILMFGSMFFWFPASAIVSTALPVILSSSMIRIRKEFCWISFLKFLFFEGLKKIVNISTEYETFIFDIISSALSLYLVQVASDFNSFRSSVGSSFRETFHKFGF